MKKELHTRPSLPPPTHEQITQRAHRLWIEAGRPDGLDREHWEKAESQLRAPSDKRAIPTGGSISEVEAKKRVDGAGKPPRDLR